MTFSNRVVISMVVLTAAILVFAESDSYGQGAQKGQQQKQEPAFTTVKGTVSEVLKKGRLTSLVIKAEAGGEPVTVPITPKIQFVVQAKGDSGFLRDKQVVSGRGTLTNEMLFVKNWTVHVGASARKLRSGAQKAAKKIGESVNSYDVQGKVVSRQQDEDYPDYETLLLDVRQLKGKPVYIDKGATVTVSMSETDRIKAGTPLEVYQVPDRGGRIRIAGIKVMLKETLKSEEFFAEDESKGKSTTRRRRRTSSAKEDSDDAKKDSEDSKAE